MPQDDAVRISRETIHDGHGHGVDVFRQMHVGGGSFRTEQVLDHISSFEASKLIDALNNSGKAKGRSRGKKLPPDGILRLDRMAQQLGVTLRQWNRSGRQFWYKPGLLIRYVAHGKGTFLVQSWVNNGTSQMVMEAQVVCQQNRIEQLLEKVDHEHAQAYR